MKLPCAYMTITECSQIHRYKYALSLSGPSACTVPARSLYDCCHVTNSYVFCFPLIPPASGLRLNFRIKFCSVLFCSDRAGRDDVTTGKLFQSRGECLGLYRCVFIIFKRK